MLHRLFKMTRAKSIIYVVGKFISFLSGPFIAFCSLCNFGAVILTAGQSTFVLAFAKIQGPLILVLLAISIFSFYITYSQVHHNRLPLIFATGLKPFVKGSFIGKGQEIDLGE